MHRVVVNVPGSSVLPLERLEGPACGMLQPAPRSLACDVDLHERGTRLTLRAMLTVVNLTQRALALDLDFPRAPLEHLGVLPAQSSWPIPEAQLKAGLRITDLGPSPPGAQPPRAQVAAALDGADSAEATGHFQRPIVWLPSLMRSEESTPTAEEESQWRSHLAPPPHEFLVRACTCSLVERAVVAGELFIGSASLYFRSKGSKAAGRTLCVPYSLVTSITKKSGKLTSSKGFVLDVAPEAAGGSADQIHLCNFGWANEIRHLIGKLAAQHSAAFERERTAENARLRTKFGLESDADSIVLYEYPCALVHSEGSSRGKMYVMQRWLCYSGTLFGKDTNYVCHISDIVGIEPTDLPAPNSIMLTSIGSEERFTFLHHRAHALQSIAQLLSISRAEHGLVSPFAPPRAEATLPADPFLETPMPAEPPFTVQPLALRGDCLLAASCYRYAVRAKLSTGCPCTLLVQVPLALQNLLPGTLEWRLVPVGSKADPPPPAHELPPDQIHDFHDLVWGARFSLHLRLPGYDWSGPVELDTQQTSERLETVRLRSMATGTKSLRLQLYHRSSCARSRHLLQVGVVSPPLAYSLLLVLLLTTVPTAYYWYYCFLLVFQPAPATGGRRLTAVGLLPSLLVLLLTTGLTTHYWPYYSSPSQSLHLSRAGHSYCLPGTGLRHVPPHQRHGAHLAVQATQAVGA